MPRRRRTADFSDAALRDIEDILTFTRQYWSTDQHNAYRTSLRESFRLLAAHPHLGRPREDLAPGLRAHVSGSHVIYYRVVSGVVTISRILHTRQQPVGSLFSIEDVERSGNE